MSFRDQEETKAWWDYSRQKYEAICPPAARSSRFSELVLNFMNLAEAEAIRQNEAFHDATDRLDDACDVAERLRDALCPGEYGLDLGPEKLPTAGRDIRRDKYQLWRHKREDEAKRLSEPGPNGDLISDAIAAYLARPYLWYDALSWTLADSLMYSSLRVVSAIIKRRGFFGWRHLLSLAVGFAIPLALIGWANGHGEPLWKLLAAVGYLWLGVEIALRCREVWSEVNFRIIRERMRKIYSYTSGQNAVISAKFFRDTLSRTAPFGPLSPWPDTLFALVDRAIERNGAVWQIR